MSRFSFYVSIGLILTCGVVGCHSSDSPSVPVTDATGTPVEAGAQVIDPLFPSSPVFNGEVLRSTSTLVAPVRLLGNSAVISNPGNNDTAHWFDDWAGYGAKLRELPNRQLGPLLFASYTVSRSTLTMNAQYPLSCSGAFATPKLQIARNDQWQDIARQGSIPMPTPLNFA